MKPWLKLVVLAISFFAFAGSGAAQDYPNKPGAGAIPATEFVARAAPDGYTLLVADIGQLAITPFLFKKVPFDPMKDFAPISMVASTPLFIAVNPSLNINSLQDLVARAKKEPRKLSYGSAGIGSIHHISMESGALPALLPAIQGNKAKLRAVTSTKRFKVSGVKVE